jgi:hypothetical protein
VRGGDVPAESAERSYIDGDRDERSDAGIIQGRTRGYPFGEVDSEAVEVPGCTFPQLVTCCVLVAVMILLSVER